jgi:hypothetical protein
MSGEGQLAVDEHTVIFRAPANNAIKTNMGEP